MEEKDYPARRYFPHFLMSFSLSKTLFNKRAVAAVAGVALSLSVIGVAFATTDFYSPWEMGEAPFGPSTQVSCENAAVAARSNATGQLDAQQDNCVQMGGLWQGPSYGYKYSPNQSGSPRTPNELTSWYDYTHNILDYCTCDSSTDTCITYARARTSCL